MKQKRTIFSLVIILVFLAANYIELNKLISGPYYLRVAIIYLLPAILSVGSLFFFHKPIRIPSALGLAKGFIKGISIAFLMTLPMFIGYAIIGELNTEMTFATFYNGILLAPFYEELLFRGYLFGQLHRFGGWGFFTAGLLNALIFGSGHLYQAHDLVSALSVFAVTGFGGLWFSWIYMEWDRNLWISIFLHFFMNFYWGVFGIADNAAGGLYANLFRMLMIIFSIVATIYIIKKRGKKALNKSNLWINRNSEQFGRQ